MRVSAAGSARTVIVELLHLDPKVVIVRWKRASVDVGARLRIIGIPCWFYDGFDRIEGRVGGKVAAKQVAHRERGVVGGEENIG